MIFDTSLRSPEYSYEVISRLSSHIIVIYEGDFVLGSLKLDSEQKLDEWKKKMEVIEVKDRPE